MKEMCATIPEQKIPKELKYFGHHLTRVISINLDTNSQSKLVTTEPYCGVPWASERTHCRHDTRNQVAIPGRTKSLLEPWASCTDHTPYCRRICDLREQPHRRRPFLHRSTFLLSWIVALEVDERENSLSGSTASVTCRAGRVGVFGPVRQCYPHAPLPSAFAVETGRCVFIALCDEGFPFGKRPTTRCRDINFQAFNFHSDIRFRYHHLKPKSRRLIFAIRPSS